MSAWAVVRTDLRLQLRYGFYAAYVFVAVAYIVVLRALPPGPRLVAVPPLLFSEASVIGFFFAGTLLHLERGDGVLSALAVTPLRAGTYLLSKMASLSLLSGLVAVGIAWAALGDGIDAPLLGLAGALTAAVFVAGGVAAAAHFRSLDRLVVWGGLGTAVFGLPVLPYLGVLESSLWWLLPTHPALLLLAQGAGTRYATGGGAAGDPAAAMGAGTGPATALALAVLTAWAALAFLLARRWLAERAFGRVRGGA